MWFTYLLLYFEKILLLPAATSSALYLIGQVVDAASTPILGYLIDRVQLLKFYPKRKTWHILGSVLVSASWLVIFGNVTDLTRPELVFKHGETVENDDEENKQHILDMTNETFNPSFHSRRPNHTEPELYLSYSSTRNFQTWTGQKFWILLCFISIGQIGWACTQISHLSMINVIGSHQAHRNRLNSVRFGGGIIANLTVYFTLFCLLHTSCSGDGVISPADKIAFEIAILIILGIGVFMNALFHFGVKEERFSNSEEEESEILIPEDEVTENMDLENGRDNYDNQELSESQESGLASLENENSHAFWLKNWRFWCVVIIYTLCRVINNSLQVFLVLYVSSEELNLGKHYIAILPFVQYIFGFISAIFARFINNDRVVLGIGLTAILTASGIILVPGVMKLSIWTITSTFALFGLGSSGLVCSSLGIISSLIGEQHQSTAAFVYSINSLFDKIATGVFVVIVKQWIQSGVLYAQFLSIGIPVLAICIVPFVLAI